MGIVQDLRVLYTKRREVNLKDYADLVRQAADGEIQADDDLLDAIERAGKSADDFQEDVETLLSRREAVKSLERAELMKKDLAKAVEAEVKAAAELQRVEEEWRKKRADAKRALDNASTLASGIDRERGKLIEDSLAYLEHTGGPLMLQEIASVQAELDQAKHSLFSVNQLIVRDGIRDGSEEDDRFSDLRLKLKDYQSRRDELQELVPTLEAKLEALEKQKLDPERMRWTEGVE